MVSVKSVFPARVGIAVKGVKPDEVGRGDIICAAGAYALRGFSDDYAITGMHH